MLFREKWFKRILMILVLMFVSTLLVSCATKAIRKPTDHPDILARVKFDDHKIGEKYGNSDVKRDFGTLKSWGTWWPVQRARIARVDEPGRDKVLKVLYPKGKVRSMNSGASWF